MKNKENKKMNDNKNTIYSIKNFINFCFTTPKKKPKYKNQIYI